MLYMQIIQKYLKKKRIKRIKRHSILCNNEFKISVKVFGQTQNGVKGDSFPFSSDKMLLFMCSPVYTQTAIRTISTTMQEATKRQN